MLAQHQYAAARRALLALVAQDGSNIRARLGLAQAMFRLGEHPGAKFHAEHALRLGAGDETSVVDAMRIIARIGAPEQTLARLQAVCREHPDWTAARLDLATILLASDRLDDAERETLAVMQADPDGESPRLILAGVHAAQGRADEALEAYDRLLRDFPASQQVLEAAAFTSNASNASPARVFASHERLGRFYARHAAEAPATHPSTDDSERPLRVGFVSHDFISHAVSFFVEKLLRHLGRPGLTVIAYHTGPTKDRTTDLLAPLVDEFSHLPGITSPDLARRVQRDRIDVLIDLNGWTEGHRLHAFQLRPAPLQMTYLGYPNTTGLPAMDVRIVDGVTDPPGSEPLATERLARLNGCFLCYAPVMDRPWILPTGWSPPPRESGMDTHVTFGSFNNLTKITDRALRAWGEILRGVPRSRLLVKGRGLTQGGVQTGLARRLEAGGVPPGAWEIMPQHARPEDHFAASSRVDIALDTFPYNGTTTTCELLSLGVPVVTLRGDRHVARVGASILTAAGLADLVADDEAAYVRIATHLATDLPRLRSLQGSVAARFLASPVCDGPAFADRFAALIRDQWRARCAR